MAEHRILIAPSILSADLARLQEEVATVEADADWLQVDVMDGHFVPNLSFGAPVIKHLKTALPLDIHLMVTNPADRLAEFLAVGAKHVTFHAEAVGSTAERRALIAAIRKGGATAGIAIKPGTPVAAIDDVIGEVDLALVMSVEPGFGGQAFIADSLKKISAIRQAHPRLMIQVDGGIDPKTAAACIAAGADNLVAGTAIFGAGDRAAAIRSLRG